MRVLSIRLKNIGTFTDAKFELTGNIIGFVGHNGSGKSTLLESIYSGITGHFRRFANLVDYVRDTPDGKASSGSIHLEVAHDGLELSITRTLTAVKKDDTYTRARQSATLTITASGKELEKITGVNDVDKRLSEILGTVPSTLGGYAFIEQGKINDIIHSDPASRTKLMHGLLGLDKYESIWTLLGNHVTTIPTVQLTDSAEQLSKDITACNLQLTDLVTAIRAQQAEVATIDRDALLADIDLFNKNTVLRERNIELSTKLAAANTAVTQAEAEVAVTVKAIDEISNQVTSYAAAAADAETKLNGAAEYAKINTRIEELKKQVVAFQTEYTAHSTKVPSPVTLTWTPEDAALLTQLDTELRGHTTALAAYSKYTLGSVVKCPTCDQEVPDVATHVTNHKAAIADLQPKFDALLSKQRQYNVAVTEYNIAVAEYNAKAAMFKQRAQFYSEQAAEFSAASAKLSEFANVDVAVYKGITDAYVTIKSQCNSERIRLNALSTKLNTAKSHAIAVAAEYETCQIDINKLGDIGRLSAQYISNCQDLLQKNSAARIALARLEEQHSALQLRLTTLTAQLARVNELSKRAAKCKFARQLFTDARDVFHRDALPKVLATAKLDLIDSKLRYFLTLMQSRFTATASLNEDGYSFKCTFDDSTVRDAISLSGGEKVRFSLSLLLAINETFASNFGMMALDEPTDALDEDNKQHLLDVLTYIQSYAMNSGMQIFIITHLPQLRTAFDQTIVLNGGKEAKV